MIDCFIHVFKAVLLKYNKAIRIDVLLIMQNKIFCPPLPLSVLLCNLEAKFVGIGKLKQLYHSVKNYFYEFVIYI